MSSRCERDEDEGGHHDRQIQDDAGGDGEEREVFIHTMQ